MRRVVHRVILAFCLSTLVLTVFAQEPHRTPALSVCNPRRFSAPRLKAKKAPLSPWIYQQTFPSPFRPRWLPNFWLRTTKS